MNNLENSLHFYDDINQTALKEEIKLIKAKDRYRYCIVNFEKDESEPTKQANFSRLENMGLIKGKIINIEKEFNGETLIISFDSTKIIIEKFFAERINVRRIDEI